MARDYNKLDSTVAEGFFIAKIQNKKTKKVTLTRIHPDKVKEYEKAGWSIEKPIDHTKMPEAKPKRNYTKKVEEPTE